MTADVELEGAEGGTYSALLLRGQPRADAGVVESKSPYPNQGLYK